MEEIVQPSLRDSLISAPSRPGPGDTTNAATWLEHLTSNVKEVEQELAQGMFTVDDDHIKSLNTLTEFNDDLVVLTIASGFKGECAILHSFVKVDGPSGPTYYALNGLYKQSQVVQIIPSRLLNIASKNILPQEQIVEFIRKKEESLDGASVSHGTTLNSISISTFDLALLKPYFEKGGESTIKELRDFTYTLLLDHILDDQSEGMDEEDTLTRVKCLQLLISHLHIWEKSNKKESAMKFTNNTQAIDHQVHRNNLLLSPSTREPEPASPLTFTGRSTQETHRQTNQSQTSLSIQNHNHDQAQAELNAKISDALLKTSNTLEYFQQTHSSSIAEKEKVSSITKSMILNLSTTDGDNPAVGLTPFCTEMLRSKSHDIHKQILKLLRSVKSSAQVSVSLAKGMNKGNLAFMGNAFDNFCTLQISPTMAGSDWSKVMQLLEEEEKGRPLSEDERKQLYNVSIVVARTIHQLEEKFKAMSALAEAICGPDSVAAQEWKEIFDWVVTKQGILHQRTINTDKLLPAKIEVCIADIFNQFLDESLMGVPSEREFDTRTIRDSFAQGILQYDLPFAIKEILEPQKKTRKADDDKVYGDSGGGKKPKLNIVQNDKQPRELRMNRDKYRTTVSRFYGSSEEARRNAPNCCHRFHLEGSCNSNCPRKDTHTHLNPQQLTEMKKFKAAAENWAKENPKA